MVAPLSGYASTLSHLEHVGAVSPIVQLHRRTVPFQRGHRAIQRSRSLLLLVVLYAAASLRFIGATYFFGGTHRAEVRLRVLLLLLAALNLAPHFQAVFFGRAAFRKSLSLVGFVGNLSEVASAFRKPETTSVKMQLPFLHKPLYLAVNCLLEVRPRSVKTKEARGLYHYIVS